MRLATSHNRPVSEEILDKMEVFVSEIQLYGTPRQIQLMMEIVEGLKKNNSVSYDAILADLRDTVRKELNLELVSGPVWWLRFDRSSGGKMLNMSDTRSNPDPPNDGPQVS